MARRDPRRGTLPFRSPESHAVVERELRGMVPTTAEPIFRRIVDVKERDEGGVHIWRADLVMFDLKPARVEVCRRGGITWLRWLSMPGGNCQLGKRGWRRDKETA